ncbi:MAG: ABC transporter ATP-binding protein [Spirochaetales bacterium]|nr:ABC transporter ATP-binding protein [Spirochaetales bacterium]
MFFKNYALFPHLSIYENIAYGLKIRGVSREEIPKQVSEVLKLVNLEGYQSQFPHQISGGEQQRVALARAIVIKPKVLLRDEPLSNLDAKLRVNTRGEKRKLQKALGITAIYVTHDQEEAMAISDRIVVINHGNIIQTGTAMELYYNPATMFVAKFIGRINSIPASVIDVLPNGAKIEILREKRTVENVLKKVKIGDKVDALIRPEFIHLDKDAGKYKVTGTIKERTFLGEKVEYIVSIDGIDVMVSSSDPGEHMQFSAGQKVGIKLNEEGIKILE